MVEVNDIATVSGLVFLCGFVGKLGVFAANRVISFIFYRKKRL